MPQEIETLNLSNHRDKKFLIIKSAINWKRRLDEEVDVDVELPDMGRLTMDLVLGFSELKSPFLLNP